MKTKRTYSTLDVEKLDISAVLTLLTVGCIVAVDVAKSRFVAALATAAGEVVRLVRFEHPRQTELFLRMVVALREAKLEPHVVMEPTGTYGDALRYQCHRREVPVHMMSPKHTHDFAEVLDGVPSMHDPKAAVVLARLQAIRPAARWVPPSVVERNLRALLDQRTPAAHTLAARFGLLESTLARHWPELDRLLDVRAQRSWMTLLQQLPAPHLVAAAGEQATELLRKASCGSLAAETIAAVLESARTTLGVPMTDGEQHKLRAVTESIEQETRRLDALDKQIEGLVSANASMVLMATTVGAACTGAIVAFVGMPTEFASAKAFEKALGLNLKEHSSGEKKGRLSLTKRGPGQVRQLLYLAALRLLQVDPVVAAWYRNRGAYARDRKIAAVVAVMRKLARALWHVARGDAFDAKLLFDARRLEVSSLAPSPLRRKLRSPLASPPRPLDPGGSTQPTR